MKNLKREIIAYLKCVSMLIGIVYSVLMCILVYTASQNNWHVLLCFNSYGEGELELMVIPAFTVLMIVFGLWTMWDLSTS